MNAPPFGLPPIVFSIIMVVSWLTLGPLVAWFFMRKRNKRIMSTAAQFSQPVAPPSPPVYPYLAPPEQPWADLVGLWQFTSAARWIGVVIGVVFAIGTLQFSFPMNILYTVPPALIALLSVLRPSRAAQTCTRRTESRCDAGSGWPRDSVGSHQLSLYQDAHQPGPLRRQLPEHGGVRPRQAARNRHADEQHAVPAGGRGRTHRDVPQPVVQRPRPTSSRRTGSTTSSSTCASAPDTSRT